MKIPFLLPLLLAAAAIAHAASEVPSDFLGNYTTTSAVYGPDGERLSTLVTQDRFKRLGQRGLSLDFDSSRGGGIYRLRDNGRMRAHYSEFFFVPGEGSVLSEFRGTGKWRMRGKKLELRWRATVRVPGYDIVKGTLTETFHKQGRNLVSIFKASTGHRGREVYKRVD